MSVSVSRARQKGGRRRSPPRAAGLRLLPGIILNDEVNRRADRRIELRLQGAGFEETCRLEDFDWSASITLYRRLLDAVFSLKFLAKHEHVLLVGPAGVGKSFMAQALGFTAIRAGYEVSGPTCAFVLQASRVDPDWPAHIHPMGQGNAVYLALPGSFIPNPSRSVQNQAEWDMLLQLAADHQERTGIPPSGDIITLSPPHLQAEDEDEG